MNVSEWAKRLRLFLSRANDRRKAATALLTHCCQLDFIPSPELAQRAQVGLDGAYAWG